jgi:hypothetical protein
MMLFWYVSLLSKWFLWPAHKRSEDLLTAQQQGVVLPNHHTVCPLLLSIAQAVARRVAYQTFNHGMPASHPVHVPHASCNCCSKAVCLLLAVLP